MGGWVWARTCPAQHMVRWTSVQYPHRLCMTGLLQLACVSFTCVVHCMVVLFLFALRPEVVLCSITLWWQSCTATPLRPAHVVAQAHPTMPCIRLLVMFGTMHYWNPHSLAISVMHNPKHNTLAIVFCSCLLCSQCTAFTINHVLHWQLVHSCSSLICT